MPIPSITIPEKCLYISRINLEVNIKGRLSCFTTGKSVNELIIKQQNAQLVTKIPLFFQNFEPYVKGHTAAKIKQILKVCRWKYPYT